ncbi:DUF6882 domain-containing protein [Cerasicoccus maritimus]|uniref:DUF6882 domain-containing protein n=1 Tax=Cerasicoccus maritimus TaxID=490089 RepID=UPI002852D914|nr:DUF6882 domain-containing protein [Cerasicoccus maritimus]
MTHQAFIAQCLEDLQVKSQAHEIAWGLNESKFVLDQVEGQIGFESPNDMLISAPVQIIGAYFPTEKVWQWSWDNNTVRPPLTEDADKVRAYGQEKGIAELTTAEVKIDDEAQCWEFTALACGLADAQGAYSAPTGNLVLFMTFGDYRIVEKAAVQTEG